MERYDKELLFWIAVMFLSTFIVIEHTEKKKERNRANYLQKRLDSLNQEQFPLDVRISRYENTLEILDKKNKKVADEFRKTMSENTE